MDKVTRAVIEVQESYHDFMEKHAREESGEAKQAAKALYADVAHLNDVLREPEVVQPCEREIIVNGEKKKIAQRSLSYEEIAELAGLKPWNYYTMTCKDGFHHFIITWGQTIRVSDGMIFSVANTGSA